MKFPCSQCGSCCRRIGKAVHYSEVLVENGNEDPVLKEMARFPFAPDELGRCPMLKNGKCTIYNNRPDICNVRTMWERYYKGKMSLRQFYELNKQACKKLNG